MHSDSIFRLLKSSTVRRIRQEDLFHLKDQIIHLSQNLEEKESILDEVRVERKSLQSELARYIAMVKQIQKDVELVSCNTFTVPLSLPPFLIH